MVETPPTCTEGGKYRPLAKQDRSGWQHLWHTAFVLAILHAKFLKQLLVPFVGFRCGWHIIQNLTQNHPKIKPWEYLLEPWIQNHKQIGNKREDGSGSVVVGVGQTCSKCSLCAVCTFHIAYSQCLQDKCFWCSFPWSDVVLQSDMVRHSR